MGMIARVLEFVRTAKSGDSFAEVKCDPGSGAIEHGQHFQPAGFDSQPLPGDAAFLEGAGGVEVALGYADTKAPGESGAGEAQIYGRDAAGARVSRVWTKADGSVFIANALGSIELRADGTVAINGLTISPTGHLTTSVEVTAAGKNLSTHVHQYVDSVGIGDIPTPTASSPPT